MIHSRSTGLASALLAVGLAFTPVHVSANTSAATERAKREITELQHNMCAATVRGDVPAHSELLAEDFLDVMSDGRMLNKAQNDEDLASMTVEVCDIQDLVIRVYGKVAIVVGTVKVKVADYEGMLRYTDTLMRRGGRWLIVSSQSTEIKP